VSIFLAIRQWGHDVADAWNRFWFAPTDPATLALVRIFAGAMLLYTHLVWTAGLDDFFGPYGWISPEAVRINFQHQNASFAWSWFHWFESASVLWIVHVACLVVFALLTIGLFSRVASVLALLATIAYQHRVPGALFGLDQINTMLVMYLVIGPCGARYSLDALLGRRAARAAAASASASREAAVPASVAANVAVRLIQVHMCVIYLFAGLAKLTGETWWTGYAMWDAFANYEYQSLSATWMADWPLLIAALTHATVFWETFYCALVWPRLTRPVMLALAVPVHLGIALFMGMITFGLVMLIGNLAFVPPDFVRRVLERRPPG
jgi:uncharacterized membrane protein YphA (DoxX/SURF4 family)